MKMEYAWIIIGVAGLLVAYMVEDCIDDFFNDFEEY